MEPIFAASANHAISVKQILLPKLVFLRYMFATLRRDTDIHPIYKKFEHGQHKCRFHLKKSRNYMTWLVRLGTVLLLIFLNI